MRVGIWCDYGFTLGPCEGIGVFADNLARGLVHANPDVKVLLVAHPGQTDVLDSVIERGFGRIEVASHIPISLAAKRQIRYLKRIYSVLELIGARNMSLATAISSQLANLESEHRESTHRLISQADVWLVPYVGLNQDFHRPHVVVVHDLVCYHFPEMLSARQMRKLKQLVDRRAAKASLVACMSQFIRKIDLEGVLKLPDHRIRVVAAAVPDDFCNNLTIKAESIDSNPSEVTTPIIPNEPFLLFPSAFRKYKNHRLLVELVARLKELQLQSMKVVFTGIKKCPRWLRTVIDNHDAHDSVLILGKVTRSELVALYRSALATVVPSLYEQGSFPLLEALLYGCPAISSDIPSLREQFREMGNDMIYFDPNRVDSLVEAVQLVLLDRNAIIAKQQTSFAVLKQRTWKDAAMDWLEVFSEAIELERRNADIVINADAA